MTTNQLIEKYGLRVFNNSEDKEIDGCYIGDLLSWVMGKAKLNDCWLTVMNNANVLAVAKLIDCACVVLCDGVEPDEVLISRAASQKVNLFGTNLSSFEFAKKAF